jgi:hypothetical protein
MTENAREQMRDKLMKLVEAVQSEAGDKTGEELIELNEEVLYIKKYVQNMALSSSSYHFCYYMLSYYCCYKISAILFLLSIFFIFLYSSLVLLSYFRFSALLLFLFYSL